MSRRFVFFLSKDEFYLSHFENRGKFLKSKGNVEIYVIAEKTSEVFVDKIKKQGITFIDSKIKRASCNPITEIKNIYHVCRILKAIEPDIITNFGSKCITYGTLAAKIVLKKVAIINNLVGLGYTYSARGIKAFVIKNIIYILYRVLLSPKNGYVVCENKDDFEKYIQEGLVDPERIFLVPGAGVDVDKYKPARLNEERNAEDIIVLMACRLLKSKGVYTYVESSKSVKSMGKKIRFQLAGKIDLENPDSISNDELRKWIEKGYIDYLGFREDMNVVMQEADIFCLPSYYGEGMPRCLAEAASCGLPIITSDNVGCRDAVENSNGLLVEAKRSDELTKAILTLVNDKRLRYQMSEKGRELAEKEFDERKILLKLDDIYHKCYKDLKD